jgi:hypothetical protein
VYFTPFRKHTALWANAIIYASLAGSVMCLLGLAWGVRAGLRSPYRGWLRWHHYAGLVFGVFTFTWVFSGLLSMDPWDWHPSTAPLPAQRDAFSGGSLPLERVTLDLIDRSATAFALQTFALQDDRSAKASAERQPKEIEISAFRGEPRVAVDGRTPDSIALDRLLAAARDAMPGVPVRDAVRLDDYDAYYYDRARELPLPVFRVRYGDDAATWLYVDAGRGVILRREVRLSRVNRWLYHGLHSLDPVWLRTRRPLWDVLVVGLCLGGTVGVAAIIIPAWQRLRRTIGGRLFRRILTARVAHGPATRD